MMATAARYANGLIRLIVGIALGCCGLASVQAQTLTDSLYSGEALVKDQSELQRLVAARTALSQALVKLSGDHTVLTDPQLSEVLDRAPDVISQFAYRTEAEPGSGGQAINNTYIEIVFAKDAMEQMLGKLNRPIWTTQRPGLVAWLIIEDGLNLRIASASQAAALKALTRTARNRGLKLKMPVMDNVDLARVDAFKVWRGEVNGVAAATPRYGEKTALIVRLNKVDTGWRARMTLLEKNKVIDSWEEILPDAAGVLIGASNGAANRMAERYAVSAEDLVVGDYRVEFSGIRNANDYAQLVSYLKSLSMVKAMTPFAANNAVLQATMTLDVSLSRFAKVLEMEDQLRAIDDPLAELDENAPVQVHYQLLH